MGTSYPELIDEVIARGRYRDDWASLCTHRTPEWYMDAKVGVFIHWGIYSVPAHGNEWYSRHMYDPAHEEFEFHRKTFGDQKEFGYKDFIPMFTGENFSAEKWVSLFRKAGFRYVMPVAEHHDGFAMYRTEFSRWNAVEMGPQRDVVGEIRDECLRQGLRFCASTHRAEHYFFMNMGRTFDSDVQDEKYADFYGPAVYRREYHSDDVHRYTADAFSPGPTDEWMQDWLIRTCRFIDDYRPSVLYFDWWVHNQAFKPYLRKLAAYYYNRADEWGTEVTINYKHEAFPPGAATFDVERGALTGISPVYWQTDTAIGKDSWGYTADNVFKTPRQVICDLVDIVSKNGNLLINIGPRPDGSITEQEQKVLETLGDWLKANGEGIYGTTFWKQFGEGEVNAREGFFMDGDEKQFTSSDFRFTYKNGDLFVFQMRPSACVRIKALRRTGIHDFLIERVERLDGGRVSFRRTAEALEIETDEPGNDLPVCYRIAMS